MAQATVHLVDSLKLGDFYFTKDAAGLALKLLGEGLYTEVGPFEVVGREGEDVAEDLFDLTNNPGRQSERRVRYGQGRSIGVGDVVQVEGDLYVCRPTGWLKLDLQMA